MNIKTAFIIPSTLLFISLSVSAETVPNIFSPNTPAKAAEVNENFDFLASKSMGMNLIDGEIEVDVDCTADAAALNKAYTEHVNYKDLNFRIKGNCYGDITVKRTFDGDNNWEGNSYQVASQSINIQPQEGHTAELIPNDLSGKVAIWGGFGGGLYLIDLTITLGDDWDYGAAFSRNGHGSVINVTIIGPDTPNGTGILLQEGAQAYISGVNISKVALGIFGNNNAAIRFIQTPSTVSSQSEAVKVLGSSVRQQVALDITSAQGKALDLDGGTNWMGWGQSITATGNNILIGGGSTLAVDILDVTGVIDVENTSLLKATNLSSTSNLQVSNSELNLVNATVGGNTNFYMSKLNAQNINATGLYLWNSSFNISSGNITAFTTLTERSLLRVENTTLSGVLVNNSTLSGQSLTILNADIQNNAMLDITTSTITSNFDVDSNSTAILEDITFNGSQFNINQSDVRILGTTKMPTSKLACWGLSQVEYEGNNDILATAPNSNCLDQSSITTLIDLVKSNHSIPE
ncbi:hypothetical protein [Thalassotalea piscium]|uniref:Uncharacterized protein n=1 Tax=Thalassotalea piscium TaxID=1230533 RepID=A0A7X0NKP3_9GAMM|nr:hypothetical protein [Thalassotalea piscium]MBB6545183.1 hypothetical protein [Thalassotalea piscium]